MIIMSFAKLGRVLRLRRNMGGFAPSSVEPVVFPVRLLLSGFLLLCMARAHSCKASSGMSVRTLKLRRCKGYPGALGLIAAAGSATRTSCSLHVFAIEKASVLAYLRRPRRAGGGGFSSCYLDLVMAISYDCRFDVGAGLSHAAEVTSCNYLPIYLVSWLEDAKYSACECLSCSVLDQNEF